MAPALDLTDISDQNPFLVAYKASRIIYKAQGHDVNLIAIKLYMHLTANLHV